MPDQAQGASMWRNREQTIKRSKATDAKQITGTDVRCFVGLFEVAPDLRHQILDNIGDR